MSTDLNERIGGVAHILGASSKPRNAPPVFIFVGHSGSGKTTLVEKLIPELTRRGLRVATIKHAHHKVVLDKEGKDSWRYKQAGATLSMLVTADELQLVADAVDQREPAQLAQRFLGEADMVLAEGFPLPPGAQGAPDGRPRPAGELF